MAYDKKQYSKKNYKPAEKKTEYKPKRGPLSKLMTEEDKQKAGIHELSYDFACRITRLFQYLTEDAEYKEYVQSKLIYRSGTSIGANIAEAQYAQSRPDFVSKMHISLKEASETRYWLRILDATEMLDKSQVSGLMSDCNELINMLIATCKTTKNEQ